MEMKTSHLIVLALVLTVIAGVLVKISSIGAQHNAAQISTYADCVAAGNPILESYPSQCKTLDGRTFVNPDEHIDNPVSTTSPAGPVVGSGCVVGGCSGEVCSDASAGPA